MYSYVPKQVRANVIFAVNGSLDENGNSADAEIVRGLLRHINQSGGLEASTRLRRFEPGFPEDQGANETFEYACSGNITYILHETRTAGKANALNLANRIASASGHTIAFCIDADSCPEPDAIPKLFRDCYVSFDSPDSQTVLMSGVGREWFTRWLTGETRLRTLANDGQGVNGFLCGWNVGWLEQAGGFPKNVTEDYALALRAKCLGKSLDKSSATVWRVAPSYMDRFQTIRRYTEGAYQLLAAASDSPRMQELLSENRLLFSTLRRFGHALSRSMHKPVDILHALATFVGEEAAIYSGRRDARRHPERQTWTRLSSTKL